MDLSIIVPAYNEEDRIEKTLSRMVFFLAKFGRSFEIIVVDDGSADRTAVLVKNVRARDSRIILLQNVKNSGKGSAVQKGMLAARGKYLLFSDADNSTPIQEIKKILPRLEENECDIVIGSRHLPESRIKIQQPFFRVVMGRVFNFLVKVIFSVDCPDTQCGFKCFTKEAAQKIFPLLTIKGFSFDVELFVIAKLNGFYIQQVPIIWLNRQKSRISPLKDSLASFFDLLRIKKNLYNGAYQLAMAK